MSSTRISNDESKRSSHAQCKLESLESRVLLTGANFADRGWISVIVDNTLASSLATNLAILERDLIADGFRVAMHLNAPRMDDQRYIWDNDFLQARSFDNGNLPQSAVDDYLSEIAAIKTMISADNSAAIAAGKTLTHVLLIGHPTVPYSGVSAYDSHEARAMPTDLYYADLEGSPTTWGDSVEDQGPQGDWAHELTTNEPGDGRFDVENVPTDSSGGRVELAVGRIDMANLAGAFGSQTEAQLINQYLERNRAWRTAPCAAVGGLVDPRSDETGYGTALNDKMELIVGDNNVTHATWLSEFGATTPDRYVFAALADSGEADAVWKFFQEPTPQQPNVPVIHFPAITSYDFPSKPVRGVFSSTFGS